MPERKWKFHSSKILFGKSSDQACIKDNLGGYLGNRDDSVKRCHKSDKKKTRELKTLKKLDNILEFTA